MSRAVSLPAGGFIRGRFHTPAVSCSNGFARRLTSTTVPVISAKVSMVRFDHWLPGRDFGPILTGVPPLPSTLHQTVLNLHDGSSDEDAWSDKGTVHQVDTTESESDVMELSTSDGESDPEHLPDSEHLPRSYGETLADHYPVPPALMAAMTRLAFPDEWYWSSVLHDSPTGLLDAEPSAFFYCFASDQPHDSPNALPDYCPECEAADHSTPKRAKTGESSSASTSNAVYPTPPAAGAAASSSRDTFAPCVRADCPCPASWNGAAGEHCCRTCRDGQPCRIAYHQVPFVGHQQPRSAPPCSSPSGGHQFRRCWECGGHLRHCIYGCGCVWCDWLDPCTCVEIERVHFA